MKKKIFYLLLSAGLLSSGLSSCKKFLDPLPDNRAELNNTEKIAKLLTSAYPETSYALVAEMSSDNVDDFGPTMTNYSRFVEQVFKWEDITEPNNDGIDFIWSAGYGAIASANAALQAIDEAGNPSSLSAQRGEALVARAYNHWILVNMFAQNYSQKYSATDLGITYMTKGETTLNPKYQRNTVKEVYDFIVKDLEEGLPLISDNAYPNSSVAKYHFNQRAAYTFAARVALFMEDWAKAAEYASRALNNNPSETLRDYNTIASFSASALNMGREYNASSIKANFLVATAYSAIGTTFGSGGYTTNNRINHGWPIARTETLFTRNIYGTTGSSTAYRMRAFGYVAATINKVFVPRVVYMFEYTDPVAGTGFARAVLSPITSEEALLTRAEANIHLKKYSDAIADMQIYINNNTLVSPLTISEASINTWANSFAYFTPTAPTPKKKLNPDFVVEPGTQENMIHAILSLRRFENLHTGFRWFDVKRYGIEISRREASGTNTSALAFKLLDNNLVVRDNRRAIQLPQDVISAGLTPNPR
ncbi:RagB/SusD family nutrient uptake outer membrane protein [Sphingobacterium spiritivorum]|uniref:RagB/SusD family nutrient uptake outer membrane protein n=1 Tax=Sphingobacterium spiritivorum TaxID=258 RepID=UPI003DA429DA